MEVIDVDADDDEAVPKEPDLGSGGAKKRSRWDVLMDGMAKRKQAKRVAGKKETAVVVVDEDEGGCGGGRRDALALLMHATRTVQQHSIPGLSGLYHFRDFVSQQECDDLLQHLAELRWRQSKYSRHRYLVTSWGVITELGRGVVRANDPSKGEPDTPSFLLPVIARLVDRAQPWGRVIPPGWSPNEGNANDYRPSDVLPDHYDDRGVSGPVIASVTLLGTADMTFKYWGQGVTQDQIDSGTVRPLRTLRRTLHPGTLQVMTQSSRYDWTHGMEPEGLHSDRRVVLVFRQARLK
eukprot:Sspe_Gene.57940::Locus_31786_Transcript_2_2_Confidence_0.600_Length_1139::g.57940::m.57940